MAPGVAGNHRRFTVKTTPLFFFFFSTSFYFLYCSVATSSHFLHFAIETRCPTSVPFVSFSPRQGGVASLRSWNESKINHIISHVHTCTRTLASLSFYSVNRFERDVTSPPCLLLPFSRRSQCQVAQGCPLLCGGKRDSIGQLLKAKGHVMQRITLCNLVTSISSLLLDTRSLLVLFARYSHSASSRYFVTSQWATVPHL